MLMNDTETCPMIMYFHAGHCERILWSGWVAKTVTELVLSAVAIFIIAFAYEALKFGRELHIRRVAQQQAELQRRYPDKDDGYCQQIFSCSHIIQSLLNVIQLVLSYLLMLFFMTFNYWLCLAVILGLGCGYFLFGWVRKDLVTNECCP